MNYTSPAFTYINKERKHNQKKKEKKILHPKVSLYEWLVYFCNYSCWLFRVPRVRLVKALQHVLYTSRQNTGCKITNNAPP